LLRLLLLVQAHTAVNDAALLMQATEQQHHPPGQLLLQKLRDTLAQELLAAAGAADGNEAAVQSVLAGCAATVLKVGQALQGHAGQQQLVQDALQALQEAPEALIHTSRDMQLVQLVQRAAGSHQQQQGWLQDLATTGLGDWVELCPEAAHIVSELSGIVE
jgi:hypothetical protein